MIYYVSGLARGRRVEFADCFAGFKNYGTVVGASALLTLVQYVAYAVALLPALLIAGSFGMFSRAGGTQPAGGEVALVLIVGFVGVAIVNLLVLRVTFAIALLVDPQIPRMGAIDSMKASWRMTEGHTVSLAVFVIVMALIAIVSFLALCVGLFLIGYPLMLAAFGVAYTMLSWKLRDPGLCTVCGYNLRNATSGVCPECGSPIPSTAITA